MVNPGPIYRMRSLTVSFVDAENFSGWSVILFLQSLENASYHYCTVFSKIVQRHLLMKVPGF